MTHLSLKSAPDCTLCHVGMQDATTVNTLFGKAIRVTYAVPPEDPAALTAALDKMKADKLDSDMDGVTNIDELVAGTDPNTAGGGVVAAKPQLTYGCAATVAPGVPAPSSGAAFGLALVAALAVARRRRSTSRRSLVAAAAATSALILVGCYDVSYVSSDVCPGGLEWTGGDRGSPAMHPGVACINCHSGNGGPKFKIAGTAYAAKAPDDCVGATDVSIIVTGADGKSVEMKVNEAGNFYTELAVKTPYTAKLVSGTKTHAMFGAQTSGDCNGCHTEAGASGAPGRITLP